MAEAVTKAVFAKRPQQGRSPAYPSIPLGVAMEKAKAQYDEEGKYPAPLSSAFKAWGYSAKSSGGRDVRASLRYFGLIIIEGEGDLAKVKLTEDALRVLTDKREDQSEKNAIIRRLALTPAAHKKLWVKYPEGIKSDATAAHYLVWEEGFNQSAAEALITEFKETAAFSRLYEPDDVEVKHGSEREKPQVKVGDLVNVERDGALVFPKAVKVLAVEEREGQAWVWTDGSEAWTEMESVTLETPVGPDPAKGHTPPPPPMIASALAPAVSETKLDVGVLEEKFNTDEGVVIVRYPDKLTTDSVSDLEAFFELFIKKAKRRAGVQ